MTNLQCFSFQSNEIRIVVDDNGNLWYVAKDVAEALGYQWAGIRNVQHVPEEWRGVESVSTPSGTQEMWCLSEQGLYFFLGRSDKPLAVPFQKWLAGDVVPSIRRTGSYGAPSAPVIDGDYLIRIGQEMNRLNQQLVVAEAKVKEMAPKARFADAVSETRNNMLIGTLAKILNDNGYPTGRDRFYETLRNDGYLCKSGHAKNTPTQRASNMGLFRMKETAIEHSDGRVTTNITTKITGKGQVFFVKKYLGKDAAIIDGELVIDPIHAEAGGPIAVPDYLGRDVVIR